MSYTLPPICKNTPIRVTRVCLRGGDRVSGTLQAGTIKLLAAAGVVSIVPRQGVLKVISTTIPLARLRLSVDGQNLSNVYSPTGNYAIQVPIALDYVGQEYMKYSWVCGECPLFYAIDRPLRLGEMWEYSWVNADGTPYTPTGDWSIEFDLIEICCGPKRTFHCQSAEVITNNF